MKNASLLLSLLLFPFGAQATNVASDTDLPGQLVQVVVSLAIVVGLIFAAGWLTRRLQGTARLSRQRSLQCLESLPLGFKERVILVQAGETQLLLGVAPGNIRTLHVFTTPIVDPAAKAVVSGFRSLLTQRPFRSAP